jgi:dienelactone hydrolase
MKFLDSGRFVRSSLGLLALLLAGSAIAASPVPAGIEFHETKTGVRYGIWSRPAKPAAPTLFILANSIEDTLGSAHFRAAGQFLGPEGWLCVSIDLPCHGREIRLQQRSGLAGWRERLDQGDNFVAEATTRLSQVLDQLIADGLADPRRIAAVGTSRGGFIALHFAAKDPRVQCVAAFAPVTDLAALTEFKGAETNALGQSLALGLQTKALAGRAVWLTIGDRDTRVGTDRAIQFARQLTAASLARRRPALVELHVLAEPRGHSLPAGVAENAAAWLRKQIP